MNIENIALVRATDIIPFDGTIKPISEVPYLKKNTGMKFSFKMNDLLCKVKKMPPAPFRLTDDYIKNTDEILKQYLPYLSYYNSMVLWSINGLVPDDSENGFGNNTFSDKKCVIIDGLAEQMELSDVVSLVPTDTAIRGNVKLSNSAIILIEENEFQSLTEEQKEKLSKFNVTTFSGDLRHAVEQALIKTNRYTPERPILNYRGFNESDTSEELKSLIDRIAKENNLLQMKHLDIILNTNKTVEGKLADEYENINIINTYFQKHFFEYLSKKMNISETLAYNLINYPDYDYYLELLCNEIESYGIENYKKLVDEYNNELIDRLNDGTLPTPQQIVDNYRKNLTDSGIDSKTEETPEFPTF